MSILIISIVTTIMVMTRITTSTTTATTILAITMIMITSMEIPMEVKKSMGTIGVQLTVRNRECIQYE